MLVKSLPIFVQDTKLIYDGNFASNFVKKHPFIFTDSWGSSIQAL